MMYDNTITGYRLHPPQCPGARKGSRLRDVTKIQSLLKYVTFSVRSEFGLVRFSLVASSRSGLGSDRFRSGSVQVRFNSLRLGSGLLRFCSVWSRSVRLFGSLRFGSSSLQFASVQFGIVSVRFGQVRFGPSSVQFASVRFGFGSFRFKFGSVRFGSVRLQFCSVRPNSVRVASVRLRTKDERRVTLKSGHTRNW